MDIQNKFVRKPGQLADLFCDGVGRLDDLWGDPGQRTALTGDIANVGVALLLRQAKVGHLAHSAPVAVAKQQVGAFQVKVHDALLVQVLHALWPGPHPVSTHASLADIAVPLV